MVFHNLLRLLFLSTLPFPISCHGYPLYTLLHSYRFSFHGHPLTISLIGGVVVKRVCEECLAESCGLRYDHEEKEQFQLTNGEGLHRIQCSAQPASCWTRVSPLVGRIETSRGEFFRGQGLILPASEETHEAWPCSQATFPLTSCLIICWYTSYGAFGNC